MRYLLTGASWILGSVALAAVGWDIAASQVPVDETGEPLAAPETVIQIDDTNTLTENNTGGSAAAPEVVAGSAVELDGAQADKPASNLFTSYELDELVGPVALYPDDLLAIVLPAASYPLQIVQAARFLDELETDPTLQPDEDWDDSVVALLNYPEVIRLLNEDLDWTWQLGQAFVDQQPDTIAAIERFRDRAYAAGNLKTDEHQVVSNDNGIIEIDHVDDDVIYVPYYEPERVVVYQTEPVYYYYPRAYPVYYYPYPVGYSFFSPFFWGVTTVYHLGWYTDHLHVYHHSYYGHPYYGHHYYDHHYYRRPSINIHVNYFGDRDRDHYRYRERDGDIWRPRDRHGSGPRDRRDRDRYDGDRRRDARHDGERRRDAQPDGLVADRDRLGLRPRPETASIPPRDDALADRRSRQARNDNRDSRGGLPIGTDTTRSGNRRSEGNVTERRGNRDATRLQLDDRQQRRIDRQSAQSDGRREARIRQERDPGNIRPDAGNQRTTPPASARRDNQRDATRSQQRQTVERNDTRRSSPPSLGRREVRSDRQRSTEPLGLRPRPELQANSGSNRSQATRRERPSIGATESRSSNNRAVVESRRSQPRRSESSVNRSQRQAAAPVNRAAPRSNRVESRSVPRSSASERRSSAPRPSQERTTKAAPAPRKNSANSSRESSRKSDGRRRSRSQD